MEIVYWPQYPPATSLRQVERDLKKAVEHFKSAMVMQRGAEAKIGITGNPERRGQQHKNRTHVQTIEERGGDVIVEVYVRGYWSHMHVIYQTMSAAQVRSVEHQLVVLARTMRHVVGNPEVTPVNMASGGGGNLAQQGPYYVYVLRKEGILHGGARAGGF